MKTIPFNTPVPLDEAIDTLLPRNELESLLKSWETIFTGHEIAEIRKDFMVVDTFSLRADNERKS